ncbi:MAG TPA: ABC transporter permease, partial [Candidatus Dojkabacteria bacterium]|nr:ABC transporter permease [Candidatus Dojkabacteria bacterium]
MNKIKFFLEKTKSSIKYLGMIAVIISLSVMFSSLCVMSLLSLSNTLQDSLNDDPRKSVGGDMSITPMEQTEENFNLVKNRLEKIKAEGLIKEYTYTSVAFNYRGYYLGKYRSTLVGYEDSRFPLEGVKEVLTPNFSMSELENVENGAVLSDMVAKRENLKVGDTFIIHSSDMYDMHQLKLIGIIDSTISSANNIYVNKSVLGKDKAYTFYVDAT